MSFFRLGVPARPASDAGRSLTLGEVLLLAQIAHQPEGWIEEANLMYGKDGPSDKAAVGYALQLMWAGGLVTVFPSPGGHPRRRAVGITEQGVTFLTNLHAGLGTCIAHATPVPSPLTAHDPRSAA